MRYPLAYIFYKLYLWITPNVPKRTILHPEYKDLMEHAFDVTDEGTKHSFYCFKSSGDMPTGRFEHYSEFLEDYQRRISNNELIEAVEIVKEGLNSNTTKGFADAYKVIEYLEQRTQIAMDTDLFFRFLSCAYVYKDEDLLSYDHTIGNHKIELFRKHGLKSFFLSEPSRRWLPFRSQSDVDLSTLEKNTEILKAYWEKLKDGVAKSQKDIQETNTKNS